MWNFSKHNIAIKPVFFIVCDRASSNFMDSIFLLNFFLIMFLHNFLVFLHFNHFDTKHNWYSMRVMRLNASNILENVEYIIKLKAGKEKLLNMIVSWSDKYWWIPNRFRKFSCIKLYLFSSTFSICNWRLEINWFLSYCIQVIFEWRPPCDNFPLFSTIYFLEIIDLFLWNSF